MATQGTSIAPVVSALSFPMPKMIHENAPSPRGFNTRLNVWSASTTYAYYPGSYVDQGHSQGGPGTPNPVPLK